jgi:DNA-binding response OmpR family regulator
MFSAHILVRQRIAISGPTGTNRQIAEPSLVLVQGRFPGRFCRRCGAEIAVANLMDADPGMDRQHSSLVLEGGRRHRLSPAESQVFTALYQRHGRVVPLAELATAARCAESKLRRIIQRLRRGLVRSRFSVLTHRAHGYELIARAEE